MLKILTILDKSLRQVSTPVSEVTSQIRDTLDKLAETMYIEDGVGLAAPQAGIFQRMIVIDEAEEKEDRNPLFLINPKIVGESDCMSTYQEGCLSVPGYYFPITRPSEVTVEYLDYTGMERRLEAKDLLAHCIQHEIDHLDGILFVDYISKLKRDIVIRKLQKTHRF